jgi:hypothetical protein
VFDAIIIEAPSTAVTGFRPSSVRDNQLILASKPIWLFSGGPSSAPLKPEGCPAAISILSRSRRLGHAIFAGTD